MKVLVLLATVGRGGVTRVIEHLLPALVEQGLDMTVVGQTLNEAGRPIAYPAEVPFIQIEPADGLPPHPNQFSFLVEHGGDFLAHAARLQEGFDLCFAMTPWWSIGAKAVCNLHLPVISCIPDFAFDQIGMSEFLNDHFRSAVLRIAERSALTVFSSEFQRQWGIDHYGFALSRTTVIPYSSDFIPTARGSMSLPGLPEHTLLAFHTLHHKDPETLLRGYAYAHHKSRRVPPLVIGGIDSDTLTDLHYQSERLVGLRRLITHELNLRLKRDLFITGFVPEEAIAGLYSRADAVLTATRSEGDISGTMNEAIRYCRPLIYSDLPVFAERITSGVHGLAFPVGDWQALGECILDVCRDPAAARARAERAYTDLTPRTVDQVAEEFVCALKSVAEKSYA